MNSGVKKTWTGICCAGHARVAVAKKKPANAAAIPVGAAVFSDPKVYHNKGSLGSTTGDTGQGSTFTNGKYQLYGHVGIYIGNGKVASWYNGAVHYDSWDGWVSYYGNGGCGFLVKK